MLHPIKTLADFSRWIERAGSWNFRFPTGEIARHFALNLPPSQCRKLLWQFGQPFFQSNWNKGRINPLFHYDLDPASLLEGEAYQDSLYTVEMRVDGKKQRANVTFSMGRMYAVELPKPIAFYRGKSLELGAVSGGSNSRSKTRAIDRIEHGRDDKFE